MRFGYTIIYVPKVSESLSFFKRAFGLTKRLLHESGEYGELKTILAFASHALGASNLPEGTLVEIGSPMGGG